MNYQLTDGEYADLHGVRCHLSLLASLMEGGGTVECKSEDWAYVLEALHKSIDRTINAIDARWGLIRRAEGMNAAEWRKLLGLVSGLESYLWRDVLELDERLAHDAAIDDVMARAHRLYRAAVTDNGRYSMVTRESTTLDFGARFERPQSPEVSPVDAQQIYAAYGAEDAEGVVAAIVAAANRRGAPAEPATDGA